MTGQRSEAARAAGRKGGKARQALLTPEERKAMSARGGRNAQASGRAHRFTSEESRAVQARRVYKPRAPRPVVLSRADMDMVAARYGVTLVCRKHDGQPTLFVREDAVYLGYVSVLAAMELPAFSARLAKKLECEVVTL
jgi:hypothetical protein